MRIDTKQRKKAMSGFREMSGTDKARQALFKVISHGKRALDEMFMDVGRMMAESIMLMDREELAGPDYHPVNPKLKKWAHEEGSIYIADQKIKINRPRLRDVDVGEVELKSYSQLRNHGQFSEL